MKTFHFHKLAPTHTFAGLNWPRYHSVLHTGPLKRRLADRRVACCGAYYSHGHEPTKGSREILFYFENFGMPGLRWSYAHDVNASIRHTGWFTEAGDKVVGIVFYLPKSRGFLAGYSLGEGMSAALETTIYSDAESAAYAADSYAQNQAYALNEEFWNQEEE